MLEEIHFKSKICPMINPIHYRIFLAAPVRFNKRGFAFVLKE